MRPPRLLLVALLALFARLAVAQATDTTRRPGGAAVSGIVYDSLAAGRLAGAVVQLVAVEGSQRFSRSAISDSLGRFLFGDVPDGRYAFGFWHPMLDSLGLEPPMREVLIAGHRSVHADLAIPSATRLRASICSPRAPTASRADSGALVVGIVRDARDRAPLAGVAVTAEWLELSFTSNGVVRRLPRLVTTTTENGWFALCDVPSLGLMALFAGRGADSTDRLELQMPERGFLRRDLYLGPARPVHSLDRGVARDTARADLLAIERRRERLGDGRLAGTVVSADGERPVTSAAVSLSDGPQTRTNERGEWLLTEVPVGTRMLEVRAIGFYPERRPVDVVLDGAPIRLVLSTLKAVLDTVRVRASRVADRRLFGFEERRRVGAGHYLTPRDIARRQPIVVSDLFRTIPGMRTQRSSNPADGNVILLRGTFEEWCLATSYIDGAYMGELSADDVDTWVHPDEVAGIEIYSRSYVPPQFSRGMAGSGCGSVVIWTK